MKGRARLAALTTALAAVCAAVPAWSEPPAPGYVLRFEDSFKTLSLWNGTSGVWEPSFPGATEGAGGPPPNHEAEFYVNPNYAPTRSADPFSLDGGLTITARRTPPMLLPLVQRLPFASGMITTFPSFHQTYGYFEMSAMLPAGAGLWPAFWLVPFCSHPVWPPEIDIMEMHGADPTRLYQTIHTGATGRDKPIGFERSVSDMSQGFHSYAVDWEPDTITFYFDGRETARAATPRDVHAPMYIIANLAVGGPLSWGGAPDAATEFPAKMQIAYIRVYARIATAAAVAEKADACGGGGP